MARKGKSSGFFGYLIFCAVLVGGFFYLFKSAHDFSPERINDQSVLKGRTFEGNVVEITSPKGIKAYLLQDKTNPIIAVSFVFRNAGIAHDKEGKFGLANVFALMLSEGAGGYNSTTYKEKLEEQAIKVSFGADYDDIKGVLVSVKDNKAQAFEMLRLVLKEPRFAYLDLERIKADVLMSLKAQTENPRSVLSIEFNKELYGEHPYGRNPIGEMDDIKSITTGDLHRFVRDYVNLDNLVVGIAGDIEESEAVLMLDEVFGKIAEKGKNAELLEAEVVFDNRTRKIEKKIAQSFVTIAARGIKRLDKDFYPLYIANHIFGGSGLSSRLSMNIRENEGLTYSIYSYLDLSDVSPLIRGGFSSTHENVGKAFDMFEKEWYSMGLGVNEEELKEAKDFLIASYNLRFSSIGSIAEMLMYMQKEKLGIDFLVKRNSYVEEVGLEDVNRVSKKYFGKHKIVSMSVE